MPNIPTWAKCMNCGRHRQVKPVGYTDDGHGKELLLCIDGRTPEVIIGIRADLQVKPRDEEHFQRLADARHKEAKRLADEAKRQEEAERAAKLRGRPRPFVGNSGKTERKRKARKGAT